MDNPARLARTVVATACSVEVGVPGRSRPVAAHAVDQQGALLFSMTEAAPDCADLVVPGWPGPTIQARASDVSGVAHPGRVRGVVDLSGTGEVLAADTLEESVREGLREPVGGVVVRLVPDSIALEWTVERRRAGHPVVDVPAEEYAAAGVDALAGWQDGWITHLDAHHRETLRGLVADRVQPVSVVRPVLADERGLVLREHIGTCRRDLRVPFPSSVRCGCEATRALRDLLAVVGARG